MAAELTDEQIIDVADDFKSSYQHAGVTVDQFDYFGFARAIWALATQQATQGAGPVLWQYRHIAMESPGEWEELVPRYCGQTLEQRKEEVCSYRYKGKPCYEVRGLYTAPPPTAEVEKKAARYDWLRKTTNYFTNDAGERVDVKLHPEQWDAMIDAHIQSDQAQAGKGDGNDQ